MKIFFYILFITFFLFSCSNDDDCHINDENICGGQNLGIDELSRFSAIEYTPVNGVNVINHVSSRRWHWRMYNDTIEVVGDILNDTSRHIFFRRNGNCVDYLSSRIVYFDDNIIFDENGNIISGGPISTNFNNLQYKQQKYIKDKILIGEVSDSENNEVKFWMEFTPDVHE